MLKPDRKMEPLSFKKLIFNFLYFFYEIFSKKNFVLSHHLKVIPIKGSKTFKLYPNLNLQTMTLSYFDIP